MFIADVYNRLLILFLLLLRPNFSGMMEHEYPQIFEENNIPYDKNARFDLNSIELISTQRQ